jgi:hypothetical protein
MFFVHLRTNSQHFPLQYQLICSYKQWETYLLRGTNWVFKHVRLVFILKWAGIATCYGLDGPGIESRWGRDFPHPSRPAMGLTQLPVQGVDCVWNVMAHAQKPDLVLRRKGRVHLNRRGRQFSRLLATEVCASAVVMLDTPCSEIVWRVRATHSIHQFPLHFPSRASPCAITFQLDSATSFLGAKRSGLLLITHLICGEEKPTRCHLKSLLFLGTARHVSGTRMPIIRSLRLY